jgi:initiation factor 1A
MPPNQKGGKGYKKGKGKNTDEMDVKMIDWDDEDGQMLGRVIKSVGNRRFRVFCNDNKERLCRLAGAIRKSQWVNEGTVVVLSLRELSSASSSNSNADDLGDILQVVDPNLYSKLKKQEGVNPNLFVQVENMDMQQVKQRIANGGNAQDEDDIFDRTDAMDEDEKEEREEKKKQNEIKIMKQRNAKENNNGGGISSRSNANTSTRVDGGISSRSNANTSTRVDGESDDSLDIDAI